jgi:hypothetical protein
MMTARTRITWAGIAVLRHKQGKGAYPASLADVKPVDLKDPSGGKPLIYRPADKGFLLYNMGGNMKNDGGTESKDSKSGDIVWRYEEQPRQ